MRKNQLIFIFGLMIFLAWLASAFNGNTGYVYDDFSDNDPDFSKWINITVVGGAVNNHVVESGGTLAISSDAAGSGQIIVDTNSSLMPAYQNIEMLVARVRVTDGGSGNAKFFAFGTEIVQSDDGTDTSTWTFIQNHSDGKFSVYNDGVWDSQITPTSNVLRANADAAGNDASVTYFVVNFTTVPTTINTTLINPSTNIATINTSMNFSSNVSISPPALDDNVTNATIYIWFENNTLLNQTTNSISGKFNITSWEIVNIPLGNFIWNVYGCGTSCNFSSTNRTFTQGLRINNVSYNASTLENSIEGFTLNLTTSSGISDADAVLIYNNTQYSPSKQSYGNNKVFFTTLSVPEVASTQNINFTWNVTLTKSTGGTYNYLSQNSQEVQDVTGLTVGTSCSTGFSPAYTYNFNDEVNITSITSSVNYLFRYGVSNNTAKQIFGNLSSVDHFNVCVNSSLSGTLKMGQGEVFYTRTNYVDRRNYLFENEVITNITQNVSLYNLESAIQTSFALVVESSSLQPYADYFIGLMRWYPNLNEYKIVDMGLTDETGSTVIHVVAEDIDYRIAVYEKDGTLVHITDPVRMLCLSTPCTYTLKISPQDQDYTSLLNVDYDFSFNETTGIWTFIYNDPTQKTTLMNLTIWRDTGTSSFSVCSSTATAYTGVLSCNTSAYSTGRLRAEVRRSASPPVLLIQKIVDLINSAFKSSYGLWLSLLIIIPIVFVFAVFSPIAAIVGGVVALIPALYFGSLSWTVVGGVAILGAIVAHFLKRI